MTRDDPQWYKDAIIYELHVRGFFDGNDDGVGDLGGLVDKLDYLSALGVTCLWLLPVFPSPLLDDGYDISDYASINPVYGTLEGFTRFIEAAHERQIKVIIELVINHTSIHHTWFQRARHAPPRSIERDFYVWSDTDKRYESARIIFSDSETSNWKWDSIAKAYYWHRFFAHEPDLNYDLPAVIAAIKAVLRFWLDLGVDGITLDAIPFLVEREGTSCENLPETHALLKTLRQVVDDYDNRVLLGNANQWPADVRPYFGDGDECQMAFNVPLMPRLFMALRLEDRQPIVEIMEQLPGIPSNCQWGLFLRNHNELTLEMVSDQERDYLYSTYASDPQSRINLGIRRRLAPLLNNDRRRIELMVSLLLSMPGTPILYYGDEIGMGDNIYLGDRNGVRTPMQWNSNRNGGFSRVDPESLYCPVNMDPPYSYHSVNVEDQLSDPSSLLNSLRRMIAMRQRLRVFGRGAIEFLRPANRRILAYLVRHEDTTVLVVANLSRSAQPVELDLSAFAGRSPVEIFGAVEFPTIAQAPYILTLNMYGFFWFELRRPKPGVQSLR